MSAAVLESILRRFGDDVEHSHADCGDETARVKRHRWLEVAKFLKLEMGFDHFIDLTAVDYLGREEGLARFEVVCHLRNNSTGARIRLKARVPEETPSIDTLRAVWKGADWFERECHEMYGIQFKGHPDLRPLLLYPEFKGYPLRKDYPIDKRQPRIKLLSPESRRQRPVDETGHGHEEE